MMADPIRVVLADDHALIRAGLCSIVAAEPDLALVGEAATSDAAWELCSALRPDVLLLDLRMPGPPATETVPWVRTHCPMTRIVVLTAHREDIWVRSLLDLGVAGYILKDDALDAIGKAVRVAAAGGTWLSSAVLPALLHPAMRADSEALTPREREVLRLMAGGLDNARIAAALGIGIGTVRTHVTAIFGKLGLHARSEAVAWAWAQGLGGEVIDSRAGDGAISS